MSYLFSSESGSYVLRRRIKVGEMKNSISESDCLFFESEIRMGPSDVILSRILS